MKKSPTEYFNSKGNFTNKLRTVGIILFMTLFIPVSGRADGLNVPDFDRWSKIEIREAFISRKTSLEFRDTFSAAEFGWHLMVDGRQVDRGSLYDTLYAPAPPDRIIRLILVERDVFSDDIVAGFDLGPGEKKYTITKNGDFALVARSEYLPDRASGTDARPTGAPALKPGTLQRGSVSFLGGDYTDYYRITWSPVSLLLVRNFRQSRCLLDAPGLEGSARFPENAAHHYFEVLDLPRAGNIRLRGASGLGKIDYTIYSTGGDARRKTVRLQLLRLFAASTSLRNSRYYESFSNLMASYDPDGTFAACRRFGKKDSVTSRIACAYFLYEHGEEADIRRLETAFKGESRPYREAVERVRPRN